MKNLTADEMRVLVKQAELTEKGRKLFEPEKMIAEATQQLLDEGVPKEIVAHVSAAMIGRMRERRMMAKLVKEIIPIQQLPEPPGCFYYDWPVTEGDDDEE
jgi:hypothetical protein